MYEKYNMSDSSFVNFICVFTKIGVSISAILLLKDVIQRIKNDVKYNDEYTCENRTMIKDLRRRTLEHEKKLLENEHQLD